MFSTSVNMYSAEVDLHHRVQGSWYVCNHEVLYTAPNITQAILDAIKWADFRLKYCEARRVGRLVVHQVKSVGPLGSCEELPSKFEEIFKWRRKLHLPLQEYDEQRVSGWVKSLLIKNPSLASPHLQLLLPPT